MQTDLDLCLGYVGSLYGQCGLSGENVSGKCCCGLYWQYTMPPHSPTGEVYPQELVERFDKRKRISVETRLRRERDAREQEAARKRTLTVHLRQERR
jgi:hypothetical protein